MLGLGSTRTLGETMRSFAYGLAALLAVATLGEAAAAEPAAAVWKGAYAGISFGGGFGTSRKDYSIGTTTGDFSVGGVIGGLAAGYNAEFGRTVVGIEADFSGSSVAGTANCPNAAYNCSTDTPWLATVRPRLGYSVGRLLPYVTAGVAVADIHVKSGLKSTGAGGVDYHRTEPGWSAGAGVEALLNARWSVKAEYLYVQLSDANGPSDKPTATLSTKFDENVVRLGFDYRF